MRPGNRVSSVLLMVCLAGCGEVDGGGGATEAADLVLRGGSVWSPGAPGAATALAVREGRIVARGDSAAAESWIGPDTEVIELAGRWAGPGFVDAHTHFVDGGFQLGAVELRDVDTPEEFAERIADAVARAPAGSWIQGGNWDEQRWGGELPRREWIDAVAPDHPVFVTRTDLHMGVANTRALEAAGITARTPDPAGGVIVREADGTPTGALKDAAMNPIYAAIPDPDEAAYDAALQAAAAHALSRGVTQIHDMGQWAHLATYRRARAGNRLPLRVYSVVPLSDVDRLASFVEAEGRGDERLWWGGLKGFVDGSLGSTTAWFHDPYDDDPSSRGILTADTARLRDWIGAADRAGLQVMVHAIGDRANDWLLDVFASTAEAQGPRDRRFRVEHAQHLTPEAVVQFGSLGVIPSMQPYHAADDGRWAERRIGAERARGTYAFRSLIDAGAWPAFGSDWTVAPLDPVPGLDAAVTRRTLDGAHPGGWVPEQRISMEEALTAWTRESARAGFADERTGVLEPGFAADIVVLSTDPFAWSAGRADAPVVDLTLVDGRIVYRREGS